jgi:hypothetical protein
MEDQSGDRLGAGEIMLFELREEFKVLQADAVRLKAMTEFLHLDQPDRPPAAPQRGP